MSIKEIRGERLSLSMTCGWGRCRVFLACMDKQKTYSKILILFASMLSFFSVFRFTNLYKYSVFPNQKRWCCTLCARSKLSRVFGLGNCSRGFHNLPWVQLIPWILIWRPRIQTNLMWMVGNCWNLSCLTSRQVKSLIHLYLRIYSLF